MSTAAIYARQSFDRHGDTLAVSRQLDLCRKFAAERGWEVVAEHVDNDRSATSGIERPEFERLLASRPERIVVWHTDRLVRLTRDLERVIDLGVNVYAVEAGHVDLSNPAGRAVAKTITAWAQYETEQKGLRQRAANDQRAAAGLPYRCQRPFGYESDGMTVRESEAAELRAAADGVIRGQSLSSLCRDLNERGILTATDKPWRTTTLKAALLSPRNAGQRRHRGQVVGKAVWPAILDDDTAAAVRAVLMDPRRSQRGPSRRYLLSGIMTCGKCHGPITGAFIKDQNKGATYRCLGHVSRNAAKVDETVVALVVSALAQPGAAEKLTGGSAANVEQQQSLRDELQGLRLRLDSLAEAFAAGDVDRSQLAAGTKRLRERIEHVEHALVSAVMDPTLREIVTAHNVADAFAAQPMDSQRTVIKQMLSTIELLPVGPGRRTFEAAKSLRIEWREPAMVDA